MNEIIFCRRIKELRKIKQLSQEELADKLGVSRQTVFSVESGKSLPSLDLAQKIAQIFDQAIEDLFFGAAVDGVDKKSFSGGNMDRDLMPFTPFRGLTGLHQEIDRFFDEAFTAPRGLFGQTVPALNIHENENGYTIELAVPGFKEDEINIEVQEDYLTIRGSRKVSEEEKEKGYIRREFSHDEFERSVSFPQRINKDGTVAHLKEGMLEVVVPKIAPAKPKVKVIKPVRK